jgi:hypothetical protein
MFNLVLVFLLSGKIKMHPAFVESIFHYYKINYYWSEASKFITIEYFLHPILTCTLVPRGEGGSLRCLDLVLM